MNSLTEIINPIAELTVQEYDADMLAKAVSAEIDFAIREVNFLKNKMLAKWLSEIIPPRVVFLAAHARKNRVRKKNTQRILKAIQKLMRR